MKHVLTAILLIQASAWAQSGTGAAQPPVGTAVVSGRVTPAPGPVAASFRSLRVAIIPSGYPPRTLETTVEADGSFRFARVPRGPYLARVIAGLDSSVTIDSPYPARALFVGDDDLTDLTLDGPIAVGGRIAIEGGGQLPEADLYLKTQPNAAARGRIDIQRVVATATGPQLFPARSDEPLRTSGAFLLLVAPGQYQLTLAALPGRFAIRSMTSGATDLLRQPLVVTDTATPDIVVTLTQSQGYAVRGRVTGAPGSIPDGVAVFTQGASTLVHADGTFELQGLPPGTYQITLSRHGLSILSGQTGSSRLATTSVVVTNQDVGNIELAWTPLIPIAGRVVQLDADGIVMPRAPNAAGSPGVAGGTAVITLTSRDGQSIAGGCDTSTCRRDILTLPLGAEGTMGVSAYPVLIPPSTSTVHVERLPPGTVVKSIRVGAVDLTKEPLTVDPAGAPIDLDVVLQHTGGVTLRGRIVTSPSAPLLPPRVTLRGAADGGVTAQADVAGDGLFEFRAVPPGTYALVTNPDGTSTPSGSMTTNIVVSDRHVDSVPLIGLSAEQVPISIQAANEAAAFLNVMAAQRAQMNYHNVARRYGTLAELIAAGLLSPGHAGTNAGYRLAVDASDSDFTVTARPVTSDSGRYELYYGRTFGARFLRIADAPPANGPRTLTTTTSNSGGRAVLADGVPMASLNGCGADVPLCLRLGQTSATTRSTTSGRVTVTATAGALALSPSALYVGLLSSRGAGHLTAVQADGAFRLDMTPAPGEYVVSVQNLPTGFRVRSVTAGGVELANGVVRIADGRLPAPINIAIESQ